MFDEILDNLFRKTRSPAMRRRSGTGLDKLQAAADAAGVADQSGVTDLANAAVSAIRAMRSKDPRERREHWKDAGIRAFSAIPIIGDVAKLGRAGKYAQTFRAGGAEARAARTTLRESRGGAVATGGGGRTAQGLSPSELLGMMGKTREQIDLADKEKRTREEAKIKQEEATAAAQELADSLKKAGAGFVGLTVAVVGFPKIVQRWSEALVESRRHLARFDGRMAASYARLDVDRTFRDIRHAQATGGTSAEVARGLSQLEEKLQPLRDMGSTLTNIAAMMATGAASEIVDLMNSMLSPLFAVQKAAEKFLGIDRGASMPLHEIAQQMIDRGRFPPPPQRQAPAELFPLPLPPLEP